MISYAQNELASATQVAKQFGEYITKVKEGAVDKIGILKNNKLNAVILSVDRYEELSEAMEILEDIQTYETIKDRLNTPEEAYLDGPTVLSKLGLSLDK
ncbi:hypothetical protein MNB_SUP05-SYMBIONT-7-205 [hydrothermal vent metagenome]|uniref:Antitoxin n=1 Tax=hydrothermal vent metagenome TaxID=652676 RepID=A0A1W1E3E7_9ZZZZ